MSPFRWSITSCSVVVVLLALAASVRAQVQVRVEDKPSSRAVHPSMVEAAIYLELYGHPDTAHRRMGVRVVRDRVELSGTVETSPSGSPRSELPRLWPRVSRWTIASK